MSFQAPIMGFDTLTSVTSNPPRKKRKLSVTKNVQKKNRNSNASPNAIAKNKNGHPNGNVNGIRANIKPLNHPHISSLNPTHKVPLNSASDSSNTTDSESAHTHSTTHECPYDPKPFHIGQRIMIGPDDNDGTDSEDAEPQLASIRDYNPISKKSHLWFLNTGNFENVNLCQNSENTWSIYKNCLISEYLEFVPSDNWVAPTYFEMKQLVQVRFDGLIGNGLMYVAFVDSYDPISRMHHVNYGDTAEWVWATKQRVKKYKNRSNEALEPQLVNAMQKYNPKTCSVIAPPFDPTPYGLNDDFIAISKEIERKRLRNLRISNGGSSVNGNGNGHTYNGKFNGKKRKYNNIHNGSNNHIRNNNKRVNDNANCNKKKSVLNKRRSEHDAPIVFANKTHLKARIKKHRLKKTDSDALPLDILTTSPLSQRTSEMIQKDVQEKTLKKNKKRTLDQRTHGYGHERPPSKKQKVSKATIGASENTSMRKSDKSVRNTSNLQTDRYSQFMVSRNKVNSQIHHTPSNPNIKCENGDTRSNKYPRKAVLFGTEWDRRYSQLDKKYYWVSGLRGKKTKSWDPWRLLNLKAPWRSSIQNWYKFTDATTNKAYYYDYGHKISTYQKPKDYNSDEFEEILYDSAQE